MAVNAPGIIKKHRVRERPADPANAAQAVAGGPPSPVTAQARLVRRDGDRALLEVACPCGNVIHVECQWEVPPADGPADAGPTPDTPQPNKETAQ